MNYLQCSTSSNQKLHERYAGCVKREREADKKCAALEAAGIGDPAHPEYGPADYEWNDAANERDDVGDDIVLVPLSGTELQALVDIRLKLQVIDDRAQKEGADVTAEIHTIRLQLDKYLRRSDVDAAAQVFTLDALVAWIRDFSRLH